MLENLIKETERLGKVEWRPMLRYLAELHARSTHPARTPFPYPWEEIGPGYCYGPAFGHWDIVHQILDVLPSEPEHARHQLLNNLANQTNEGLIPGSIFLRESPPTWSTDSGHPPVWPAAAQSLYELTADKELLRTCFDALVRQIRWFEAYRRADDGGFYYLDIVSRRWESGVDEGVRFDRALPGRYACVDATSHVDWLYQFAADWAAALKEDDLPYRRRHSELRRFITDRLFDPETGFFHDIWAVGKHAVRHLAFEGMWPVVTGSATPEQAQRVIDENLLDPERFLSEHPIATVGVTDPAFELRMWRGPAWNSMTYWAAFGCRRYGRRDAAAEILERALDSSARQFEQTGVIWEFYHPHGLSPELLQRKPNTRFNKPCADYVGHNPLIAMARMWQSRA